MRINHRRFCDGAEAVDRQSFCDGPSLSPSDVAKATREAKKNQVDAGGQAAKKKGVPQGMSRNRAAAHPVGEAAARELGEPSLVRNGELDTRDATLWRKPYEIWITWPSDASPELRSRD